jgi:hypothetical protein
MQSLLEPYKLREESRKWPDHFISNEIVYLTEFIPRDFEGSHVFSKEYLAGDIWLEMEFILHKEGEAHFKAIIETAHKSFPPINGEMNGKGTGIDRNHPVFIQFAKLIQLPKRVPIKLCPSVVRLHPINHQMGFLREERKRPRGPAFGFGDDRKIDSLLVPFPESARSNGNQLPRKLVKGRAKATHEISKQHRNYLRSGPALDSHNINGILNILIAADGIGWLPVKTSQFQIERIEMVLRPINFHAYVNKGIHDCSRRHPNNLAHPLASKQ